MKKLALLASTLLVVTAAPLAAQGYTSIGAGYAQPTGDLGDFYDRGYTIRAETGLSLVLTSIHFQSGWTRFSAKESVAAAALGDAGDHFDVYHVGAGGRLGVGLFWLGLNGAYFFGDGDDGLGYFPEVGVGLGPLEVVADYRLDGDAKWLGLRGALKF